MELYKVLLKFVKLQPYIVKLQPYMVKIYPYMIFKLNWIHYFLEFNMYEKSLIPKVEPLDMVAMTNLNHHAQMTQQQMHPGGGGSSPSLQQVSLAQQQSTLNGNSQVNPCFM